MRCGSFDFNRSPCAKHVVGLVVVAHRYNDTGIITTSAAQPPSAASNLLEVRIVLPICGNDVGSRYRDLRREPTPESRFMASACAPLTLQVRVRLDLHISPQTSTSPDVFAPIGDSAKRIQSRKLISAPLDTMTSG